MNESTKSEMALISLQLTPKKGSVAFRTFLGMKTGSHRIRSAYFIVVKTGSGLALTFNLQIA